MTLYYLGLGSNQDAEINMQRMLVLLQKRFDELLVSSVVRTEAEGCAAADYLNAVVCFKSDLSRVQLNQWCKQQEDALGRKRGSLVCHADMDILQVVKRPLDVSVSSIKEVFFQPLLKQLVSVQSGAGFIPQVETISIKLATGEELGVKPQLIKANAVEVA
ncbi:hypothetical protein EOPP23_02285 [Endozoicomonas sp. OPT23]|uniref:2-amino-4-hydroxy-6- hydroxymethyldihydropteridine diphosphokinase n=1 Tax=Endozoicomonas sp. OPT23 TaxID=2072845 RepID=UPI00129AC5F9|nr:2-amino-4-hydroxy-6-hydroxymethyldihydropteridine diphosphokinase [Endozoicomonas sp. OPT23]MRI31823.1 hypothetical protein [Endozoicomonas sp. OPT23]